MNEQNLLTSQVMRRVFVVYWLRRVAQPVAVKTLGVLAAGLAVLLQVSLVDVWLNSPQLSQPTAFSTFLIKSFLATDWLVKFGVMILALSGGWLALDAVKNLSPRLPRLPFRFSLNQIKAR